MAYPCLVCGDGVADQDSTCSQECREKLLGLNNYYEMVCECCKEPSPWDICPYCDATCGKNHVPKTEARWDGQVNVQVCHCEGSTSLHYQVGSYIYAVETDCELNFYGPEQMRIQLPLTDDDIPF